MGFADERDIHLLPKVGAAWRLRGTQDESMTPGTNEKHSRAGALHPATGQVLYGLGPRKNNGVLRNLLPRRDHTYPAHQITRLSVVVDTDCIHKATAVEQWVASHPRFALFWFPMYCPRANPLERVCGAVHDKGTRNHTRKRRRDLGQDVEQHMEANGPWQYRLSQLYEAPEVIAAVEHIVAEKQAKIAA
jgi:transposase